MASRTPHRAIGHVPAHARIVAITEYYISASFRPVKAIATASQTGHATTIINGLGVSLHAVALPVTVIPAGLWIAYSVAGGLYGVALAATAMLSAVMLSMAGIVVAAAILTPIGMLCERSL